MTSHDAASAPPRPAAADAAFADIDTLFQALHARLANAAGVPATVLECAVELQRLAALVGDEAGVLQAQARALDAMQGSLAGLRRELHRARSAETDARHRALHDTLTRLPNAELFRERTDAELARPAAHSNPIAVLFLDLDDFKQINDRHGHETGDAVLRVVAARLLRGIRAEDLISRVGGDEFACLLVDVADRAHLTRLLRQMLEALSSPMRVAGLTLRVHSSIGVACGPEDGAASALLMRKADAAMYRAKRERSGYAFFDECTDDIAPAARTSVFGPLADEGTRSPR